MKDFKFVLSMQLGWLAAAMGFHLVSLFRILMGMEALSLNSPVSSLAGLSLFLPVILLGWNSRYLIYGLLNGLLIGLVFYKGYLFQVLDLFSPQGLSNYPSIVAGYAGILINSFGVPVGVYGSYLALTSSRKA